MVNAQPPATGVTVAREASEKSADPPRIGCYELGLGDPAVIVIGKWPGSREPRLFRARGCDRQRVGRKLTGGGSVACMVSRTLRAAVAFRVRLSTTSASRLAGPICR